MSGSSKDPVEDSTDKVKAVYKPDSGTTDNYYGSGDEGDGPGTAMPRSLRPRM